MLPAYKEKEDKDDFFFSGHKAKIQESSSERGAVGQPVQEVTLQKAICSSGDTVWEANVSIKMSKIFIPVQYPVQCKFLYLNQFSMIWY